MDGCVVGSPGDPILNVPAVLINAPAVLIKLFHFPTYNQTLISHIHLLLVDRKLDERCELKNHNNELFGKQRRHIVQYVWCAFDGMYQIILHLLDTS